MENHNPGGGGQETYVASIHGTQVRLVAAMFSQAYLEAIRSGTMPEKQEQNIRRSKFFELKTPGGRKEALRMLYGLGHIYLEWTGRSRTGEDPMWRSGKRLSAGTFHQEEKKEKPRIVVAGAGVTAECC